MSDHAFIAPSSAHIWGPGGCAAHPTMAARYPDNDESEEAREGTAAHDYVALTLQGKPAAAGNLAHNGYPISEDMVTDAIGMLTEIAGWRFDCAGLFAVEQRVIMPEIHPTLNWGTTDVCGVNMAAKRLYVRDYKYGHRFHDAYEHWQMVDYAVGAARFFGVTITPEWTVDMGIHQPRSFHKDGPFKQWVVTGARFQDLAADLAYAARKAGEDDPDFKTGPYCRDCSAKFHCGEFWKVCGSLMDFASKGVPVELTMPQAASALRYIQAAVKRLEAMTTGIEAELFAFADRGGAIPHFEIGYGDAREKWTMPAADVLAMGQLFGKDLTGKLITPQQARDLGIDDAVISEYSTRPRGKKKLIPTDSKAAEKVFK